VLIAADILRREGKKVLSDKNTTFAGKNTKNPIADK
jgi:hypothetical protein